VNGSLNPQFTKGLSLQPWQNPRVCEHDYHGVNDDSDGMKRDRFSMTSTLFGVNR
jgi:hypothetical protein